MTERMIDGRRVAIFLLIAFGFTWTVDLVIWRTAGQTIALGATTLPLATVLLVLSMFGPALAHLLTRALTGEGWQGMWLRPRLNEGWRYGLLLWLLTPLLIGVGAALYFALFPHHLDPSLSTLQQQLVALGIDDALPAGTSLQAVLAIQLVQGILLAPVLNAIPILGEEFGWRAYLQPKLLPLGERRMYLVMGLIWGLWHAPIIALGHNFGTDYAGHPWVGMLVMIWFCFIVGTFLGWATLRAESVWPAVIGHGMINGVGGAAIFAADPAANPLLGPAVAGLIGSVAFAVVALLIIARTAPSSAPIPRPHAEEAMA